MGLKREEGHIKERLKSSKKLILTTLALVVLGVTPYMVQNISKAEVGSGMVLTGERLTVEDAINLDWKEPDKNEPYTYKVFSKKPGATEFQSISSTDLKKEVKVLNVYPEVDVKTTYTTWDGTTKTIDRSASAEKWVEEPNQYHTKGFGMGLIDVEPVAMGDFNKDPKGVLEVNGEYKYDVVFFGSWDTNNMKDITEESRDEMIKYINSGRGVLFGHDTIDGHGNKNHIFATLRSYANIKLKYFDSIPNVPSVGSTITTIKREGLLTQYPWEIGNIGTNLNIPLAHSGGQIAMGDVWMTFKDSKQLGGSFTGDEVTEPTTGKGTNNYYLTTWNNTAMIQTGHSNATATLDEQKVLTNTLFYLSQLTTDTGMLDRSAMDVQPPKFMGNATTVKRVNDKVSIYFPDATEEESLFEYYVEATGQNTGKKVNSETIQVSNTSGFAGYSYTVDEKTGTVPDNKVELTESTLEIPVVTGKNRYVHIVAVDKKGNSSEPLHIEIDGTPPELELSLGTTEWINSEVVINYTAKDSSSGLYKVQYSIGGTEYITGKQLVKSFRVNTNGGYSVTVEDRVGNTTTKTIKVSNIDKDKPNINIDYKKGSWTKDNVKVTATGNDTASGVKNVRMSTEVNSKNLVTMADLQGYSLDTYEEDGLQMYFKSKGDSKFGGVQIPKEFIKEDAWHALSFDMTKLEGNITRIGGHAFIESETYVYIDGKMVSHGEGNVWTESVPYPNDTEKHHVTVVFLAGDFGENANDNLYIQPNRNLTGSEKAYEAIIENVQLEHGNKETPYEPNYKDLLEDVNPLEIDISENGEYTFTVTDKAGNEQYETITISNIDKGSPIITTDYVSNGWTKEDITVNATFKDELTGVAGVVLPDNTFHGVNNIAPTDIEFWEYGHYHGAVSEHGIYNNDTLPGRVRTNTSRFLPLNGSTTLKVNMDSKYYLGIYYYTESNLKGYMDGQRSYGVSGGETLKIPTGAMYARISVYRKDGSVVPVTQESLEDIGLELTPNVTKETITIPFKATKNGEYVLKAKDTVGNTTTKRVEVTNIDKTAPTLKVSGNPQDYTEDEEVTLQIEAVDTESGVRSITLPGGKVVSGNKTSFKVNANGTYEVVLTDNLGNKSTHPIKVDKIKVPYTFYLMDAKGKPLSGAGFNLLRNGFVYAKATSDTEGLVDFGKVPADGTYAIKQTKAPEGYIIDPTEKDVDVGDTTEPEEFVSYPRGSVLPATGTNYYYIYGVGVFLILIGIIFLKTRILEIRK